MALASEVEDPAECRIKPPDSELRPIERLELAIQKPVAFALKTLLAYDGNLDAQTPLKGRAIRFKPNEYLHIKEVNSILEML